LFKKILIPKSRFKWVIIIVLWTFILSILISFISGILIGKVNLFFAFLILIIIILFGIIFDVIGIAVAAASETPFHAMASNKVPGAKEAIALIRNNDKVSNFCNDVIGDIAGIISGVATATIVIRIVKIYNLNNSLILSFVITGIVAALTVGGKAVGKTIGIAKSKQIIHKVGHFISYFDKIKRKKKVGRNNGKISR
jgi:CBS domain containing-hemolysin-like protein